MSVSERSLTFVSHHEKQIWIVAFVIRMLVVPRKGLEVSMEDIILLSMLLHVWMDQKIIALFP